MFKDIRTGPLRDFRIARSARRRNAKRAKFIAITGSSTKSTTTQILSHILSKTAQTRAQVFDNTINSTLRTLNSVTDTDAFVVQELGAGKIGGLPQQAKVVRPDVAIVTMVRIEHRSSMKTLEGVAEEKSSLVRELSHGGLAVLNGDDPHVVAMAEQTQERVVTFGVSEVNDYRAVGFTSAFPKPLEVKIQCPSGSVLELQTQFWGEHFWLPVTAAATAALELNVSPEIVQAAVAEVQPLSCRMEKLEAGDGRTFLLDTEKAPEHSLHLAFDVVRNADAPFRRIVLGAISDTARAPKKLYRDAYRLAREAADQVIFVGNWAHKSRAGQKDREEGRFLAFETAAEASAFLKRSAVPGELVLVKSSGNLHLERIALDQTASAVKCWPNTCIAGTNCIRCGYWQERYTEPKRKGQLKLRRLRASLRGDFNW